MQRKQKKHKKAEDIIYFISVLAAASVFLAYFSMSNPEMTFEKRAVAEHTTIILNAMGIDAVKYNNVIRAHGKDDYRMQVYDDLSKFANEGYQTREFIELRFIKPDRNDDQIINAYVADQQRQGNKIYMSTATISPKSKPGLEVDIVPECVGWMGFFAITALIIAYPRVEKRKRAIGIIIAIPLMHAVNILRLVTTVYAGYYFSPQILAFTHDILWKTILLFWALALWLFWIHFIVDEKQLFKRKTFLKAKRVRKK